jgi:hypothetical protein
MAQRIENVQTFAGQTATFSFWGKADSARTVTSEIVQSFGSGGSGAVVTSGASHSFTTAWQRFTVTFTVPSISGKTVGTSSFLSPRLYWTTAAGSTIDTWGWQLEAGSVATAFQTATATIQGELAACQRYYWRNYSTTSTNFGWFGVMGTGASSTSISGFINHPVKMRVSPTSLDFQNLSWITAWGAGVTVISNAVINTTGTTDSAAIITLTTTGATAGQLYYILSNNGNNYIGLSAEL